MPDAEDATGLPFDAEAPSRRRPVRPFSEAMNAVLKHFGMDANVADAAGLDAMLRAWPDVAGPDLAKRLRPDRFDRGFLYVTVGSNAELFEIRQFKLRDIEAKAKKHPAFAGLRQIRLHAG
jgi:hypothetical protein